MSLLRTYCSCLALLLTACNPSANGGTDWPWENPDGPEKPEKPEFVWEDVSADYSLASKDLKLLRCTDFKGSPALVYAAVADADAVTLDLWCINDPDMSGSTDALRTPSSVFGGEKWDVVMNAGYFYVSDGLNYSASLALREGILLAQNINYASQDWKTMYYPTRAIFLRENDGYRAAWSYYNNSEKKTWVYPSPARNNWSKEPLRIPSSKFPGNAAELSSDFAIGGGPVLLKDSTLVNTYENELFLSDVDCTACNPRSAIGYTARGEIVFLVCEGREMTPGVKGLTTEQLGSLLLSLGCTQAINLDGGGSTCMLVGGKETVKPSDGSQRPVASTLMLKLNSSSKSF